MQNLVLAAVIFGVLATSAQASVEISSNPTHNMNCSGGVCSPTAKKAVLNATDLANMLAASDVKVVTGSGAVTITVSSSFSWTSSHRLRLDANLNVSFRAPVEVAGQGAVTIVTNDGGTGGDLLFFPGASLDFWDKKSGLIINGDAYTLVREIRELKKDVQLNDQGHYALAKSIDSGGKTYTHSPIRSFKGTFEGLGHSVSHLNLENGALFENQGGTVRDLALPNVSVAGGAFVGALAGVNGGLLIHDKADGTAGSRNAGYAGGLVGRNDHSIVDCSFGGTVSGEIVGGLVGFSSGSIDTSYSSANVTGYPSGDFTAAGGLTGESQGPITNSHASGSVTNMTTTNSGAGGLVGANGSTIVNSYSTGAVTSPVAAGGLVAQNEDGSTIRDSWASGSVTGSNWVGGLTGVSLDSSIMDSYATGDVSIDSGAVGGLVGETLGNAIATSYSTGAVSVQHQSGSDVGGLIGRTNSDDFAESYWNLDTSGVSDPGDGCGSQKNCPGVSGLTDAQFKTGLPVGFDPQVWRQNASINNGYPYLLANPPPQ